MAHKKLAATKEPKLPLTTSSDKKKRAGTKFGAKKGKQFERQIATALGHIFPDAERMLEYQGSNVIGVDLQNTDRFLIQCKCWANYANPNIVDKEIRIPKDGKEYTPVLVTKANARRPMAVLPFEDFVALLEIAYGHRERLINPYVEKPQALPEIRREVLPFLTTEVLPADTLTIDSFL